MGAHGTCEEALANVKAYPLPLPNNKYTPDIARNLSTHIIWSSPKYYKARPRWCTIVICIACSFFNPGLMGSGQTAPQLESTAFCA